MNYFLNPWEKFLFFQIRLVEKKPYNSLHREAVTHKIPVFNKEMPENDRNEHPG